jgi:hypothetical protein
MTLAFKPKPEAIKRVLRANRAVVIQSDPAEVRGYKKKGEKYDAK